MIRRTHPDGVRTGLRDEIFEMETLLFDPDVRHSFASVNRLLHPEFREYGSSGRVYDKETMLTLMVLESPAPVRIRDFGVKKLGEGVALATYCTVGTEGKEARRSSVWVRGDAGWQVIFHQGTSVPGRPSHR